MTIYAGSFSRTDQRIMYFNIFKQQRYIMSDLHVSWLEYCHPMCTAKNKCTIIQTA